jgi:hypothetical protein
MKDNIGSVNNRGIELSLSTVNIRTKDLTWTTSFTFASNKNAIRSLYGKKEDVIGEKRFIGAPVNVIYDYHIIGIWTQADYDAGRTEYKDANGNVVYKARPGEAITEDVSGDGLLGTDDRMILGSPFPEWTGGFVTNLRWKNWDFSLNLTTKQGVLIYDYFSNQYGNIASRGTNKYKYDFYVPVGAPMPDWSVRATDANGDVIMTWKNSEGHENAEYPIYNNGGRTTYYGDNGRYQDASFVKIRNITLGYTLNNLKKYKINSIRLYSNVLNPFIFTKYPGWDPEFAATQMQYGNGPSNITVQFGVNIKF